MPKNNEDFKFSDNSFVNDAEKICYRACQLAGLTEAIYDLTWEGGKIDNSMHSVINAIQDEAQRLVDQIQDFIRELKEDRK